MALPIEIAINNYRYTYQVFTSSFDALDGTASDEPYVLPPLAIDRTFGSEIAVSLVNSFQTGDTGIVPAENDDFSFAWGTSSTDATITIKANNIWNGSADAKRALRQNFADFLAGIETMEVAGTLFPGGTHQIRRRLAEAMPLPFSDVLYFYHGLNAGVGVDSPAYADLQAGMRVRVENIANQFVAPGSSFNGLVTSSQAYYSVNAQVSDNQRRLSFEPFMESISAPNLNFAKAANLLDFATASRSRRHFRVVYPADMPDGSEAGSDDKSNHTVIIGADSLDDLQSATGDFAANATTGNQAIQIAFLRGRAYIIPEIKITFSQLLDKNVQHIPQYVSVGTTLRNILDSYTVGWNPNSMISRYAQMVFLKRLCTNEYGVPGYKLFQMRRLRAEEADPGIFDLPLVAGDRVLLRYMDV